MTPLHPGLRWLLVVLGLALAGGLVVPVAAYMAGKRVIGAYEGKFGLQDFLGSIYGGLAQGEFPAWFLVLAPALVVAAWWGVGRLWSRTGTR